MILTVHATKVNRTEPNRKRVWSVKITPLVRFSSVGRASTSATEPSVQLDLSLELSADGPQTAGLVQPFQTVAEDAEYPLPHFYARFRNRLN